MNYLAHSYLSGKNKEVLIGNFIADAVKGKAIDNYALGIRKGISLHRAIDHYTDHHPIQKKSRSRLQGRYGHYSGVLVDIYYDHFLAKNWNDYNEKNLAGYTAEVYSLLRSRNEILPEKIKFMLEYMIPQNWLLNYAKMEGIERVLYGMSRRTQFDSHMEHGVEELKNYYAEFETEFRSFFPELIEYSKDKLKSLS